MAAQPSSSSQGQRHSRRAGLRNSLVPLHQRLLSNSKSADKQENSPLFSILPTEIRTKIFTFALSDHEGPELHDTNTTYWRPSHRARRITSTTLLRTCRAIYSETWFLPLTLREQTIWLSAPENGPPTQTYYWDEDGKTRCLLPGVESDIEPESDVKPGRKLRVEMLEIESLHIFARMLRIEDGTLAGEISAHRIHPRRLTLTVRHTDWRYWREDRALRFPSKWIKNFSNVMSPLTKEFRIELETYERKKDQVDAIGKHIAENWFFGRSGGTILYADVSGESHRVSRWTGSSTWHKRRWPQFESSEGKVDYYVLTITFETEFALRQKGGVISETAKRNARNPLYEHVPVDLGIAQDGDEEMFATMDEDLEASMQLHDMTCAVPMMQLPDWEFDDDL